MDPVSLPTPNWQLQTGVDCCSVLRAGSNFTSEQLHVLSTLAVVAVLIVNVTYFGWAQPPGGATPSWQSCSYHYLFLFQLLNGIAFVLSMTAVVAVTLLPLTVPMHPRYAVWCGSILVALSSGVLIAAFMFAGLVSVGYAAPSATCAAIRCNEGGVPCRLAKLPTMFGNTSVFAMDHNLASLNGLSSPAICFGNKSLQGIVQNLLFAFDSDLNLPSDVLCASEVPTAVSQTHGLSSSLSAYPNNTPFISRPKASLSEIDLLQTLDPQTFVLFSKLRYICYSPADPHEVNTPNSSLCDTWAQVSNSAERLSVDPSGAYLTAATMMSKGGLLFHSDNITINKAGSLSTVSSALAFIRSGTVQFHGLGPKVLKILAVVFGSCILGLVILVIAAHLHKMLACVQSAHQRINMYFGNLADEQSSVVLQQGSHDAPQE